MNKNKKFAGFTLIELLVVIIIIGILATISVNTFNGYFRKTRDAKRIQQFTEAAGLIKKYTILNEKLPTLTGNSSPCGGWRVVNKEHKDRVIEFGTDFQYNFTEDYFDGCKGFNFYVYPAGTSGCPVEKGPFMIFTVPLEQLDGGKTHDELGLSQYKNFICPHRTWRGGHLFSPGLVFGIFQNGDTAP